MNKKEIDRYNRMYDMLKKISKGYMTPSQLREDCEKKYGLEFEECIEMTYENIQEDAKIAIHGIRRIKEETNPHQVI